MDTSSNDQSINDLSTNQGDAITRRIKALRQQKKINQVALANFFGIDRSSYHRMENRGAKLSLEQLGRIAGFLGVPLTDLVSEGPLEVPAALREAAQLRERVAELDDRLSDKQQLLDTVARQADQVGEQIELLLVRYAHQIDLGSINAEAPLGTSFRLNPALMGPAVERFAQNEQTQLLLGEPFTGRQLVYLAANLSLLQEPFFTLVIKLIEQSLLPADSLYGQAFVYVNSTEQVYRSDLGSVNQRRQQGGLKTHG